MTKYPRTEEQEKAVRAMSKGSEQTFTPEDFQKRFDAAAKAAQREYCDIFAFWRACRLKACRRARPRGNRADASKSKNGRRRALPSVGWMVSA